MSQVSLCSVCGKLACVAVLKDPFGKSDVMVPYCADHAPRVRFDSLDPGDRADAFRND